jgi:large subunit ribosomal protein L21
MYAVIKTGGKQHRVKSGDVIEVELVQGSTGDTVEFKPLLVVDDDGKTHHGKDIAKAVVVARLAGEQKGEKVKIFKYRPKSGYARRQGHRQMLTLLEIEDVRLDGKRSSATKTAEPKEAAPKEAAEPKAAEPKAAEPKAAEPKAAEPKAAEPKAAEPKAAEPKAAEPKAAEPKESAAEEPEEASEAASGQDSAAAGNGEK